MPLNRLTETGDVLLPTRRDTQTTSLSIDGMARFFCSTWEEVETAQGPRGFDIIIIGSGMYGAYVASKLFEFGEALGPAAPRIVVLEAGPFLISEHVENLTAVGGLRELVDQPLVGPASQRQLIEQPTYLGNGNLSDHARCVGGKSMFWGGWSPRQRVSELRRVGSPWPVEVVDYLYQPGVTDPADGYPFIEWETGVSVATDFVQGDLYNALLQRGGEVFDDVTLPGNATRLEQPIQPPLAIQGQAPDSGLFSFDKFSSVILLTDAIRRAALKKDPERRLFLIPNAQAVRVETDRGIVTGVRVAVIDRLATGVPFDKNQPKTVRFMDTLQLATGGSVILAAHTIESTRLALNSFKRPAALGSELMGRNLMAHVRSNHVWQVKRSALPLPSNAYVGNAAMHVPGLSRQLTNQGRQGDFHFQFYASASPPPGSSEGPTSAEENLYRMLPNFDQVEQIRDARNDLALALGIRTCGEMFGDRNTPIPTNLPISWMDTSPPGGVEELFIDQNGTVLDRAPRAFVKMVETPDDKAVRDDQTAAAFEFIAALAGVSVNQSGQRFADFQAFLNSTNSVRYLTNSNQEQDGIGTTYHESGTLWMGDDPLTSVTDVHGRFHHVSNAYVCDQSLFPTCGSANPAPTGLALSRKVARGIIGRYTSAQAVISAETGFNPLYTGNRNNWTPADANNFFDVVPEAGQPPILGAGVANQNAALGVLIYQPQQFQNFELRLQYRTFSPFANGGIFLRAPQPTGNLFAAGGFYETALEVQIDEKGFDPDNNINGSPRHRTGALYSRLPANRWAAKAVSPRDGRPGYWNDYVIRVQGANIEIELNGEPVCSGPHNAALAQGFVGVQCHTEVVQYRSIRIRTLET